MAAGVFLANSEQDLRQQAAYQGLPCSTDFAQECTDGTLFVCVGGFWNDGGTCSPTATIAAPTPTQIVLGPVCCLNLGQPSTYGSPTACQSDGGTVVDASFCEPTPIPTEVPTQTPALDCLEENKSCYQGKILCRPLMRVVNECEFGCSGTICLPEPTATPLPIVCVEGQYECAGDTQYFCVDPFLRLPQSCDGRGCGDDGRCNPLATSTPRPTATLTSRPTSTNTPIPNNCQGTCISANNCGVAGSAIGSCGPSLSQICCAANVSVTGTPIGQNECQRNGGTCYSGPSCLSLGRVSNSGWTCNNFEQVCCGSALKPSPTFTPKATTSLNPAKPTSTPVPQCAPWTWSCSDGVEHYCYGSGQTNETCASGKCAGDRCAVPKYLTITPKALPTPTLDPYFQVVLSPTPLPVPVCCLNAGSRDNYPSASSCTSDGGTVVSTGTCSNIQVCCNVNGTYGLFSNYQTCISVGGTYTYDSYCNYARPTATPLYVAPTRVPYVASAHSIYCSPFNPGTYRTCEGNNSIACTAGDLEDVTACPGGCNESNGSCNSTFSCHPGTSWCDSNNSSLYTCQSGWLGLHSTNSEVCGYGCNISENRCFTQQEFDSYLHGLGIATQTGSFYFADEVNIDQGYLDILAMIDQLVDELPGYMFLDIAGFYFDQELTNHPEDGQASSWIHQETVILNGETIVHNFVVLANCAAVPVSDEECIETIIHELSHPTDDFIIEATETENWCPNSATTCTTLEGFLWAAQNDQNPLIFNSDGSLNYVASDIAGLGASSDDVWGNSEGADQEWHEVDYEFYANYLSIYQYNPELLQSAHPHIYDYFEYMEGAMVSEE